MLHVFYVFSNITARMVPLVIEHLALDATEVLIILDRSQIAESLPSDTHVEQAGFVQFENRWPNVWANWRGINYNSRRISDLTNNRKFIAYLPSPSFHACQQLLHHPLCDRYWLIEEGLTSYCPPGVIPVVTSKPNPYRRLRASMKVSINGAGRVRPTDTDFPHWRKYAGCIASDSLCFPGFPQPVINIGRSPYHEQSSSITRLLVMDKLAIFTRELQESYLEVVRSLVRHAHVPGDCWGYKLHPGDIPNAWVNDCVARIFSEELPPDTPCLKLSQDVCAEDIGIAKGVTTYSYMSTCLFYIHRNGGNSVSIKEAAEKRNPDFLKIWNRYFPPELEKLVGDYPMIQLPL